MEKRRSYPHAVTEAFLCLAFSLYLLFPGFHGYSTIQEEKAAAFYGLFGLYVLAMVPYVLHRGIQKPDAVQVCGLLYLLFTGVSCLLSPYGTATVLGMSRHEGLVTVTLYVMIFFLVGQFAPSDSRRWMAVFAAAMTVFCVLCLAQMLGFDPLNLYPEGLDYFDANNTYSGIFLGTVGNAGLVGVILCLSIPLFAAKLLAGENLYAVPVIACLLVLVLMDVAAPILGLLAGAGLCLPGLLPIKKPAKRWAYGLLAAAAAAMAVYAMFFARGGVLKEAGALLRGQANMLHGSGRIYIWQQVLARVPENLWFGTGPDTMLAARITGFAFGDGREAVGTAVDLAHNEYLNILYHQGIFALAAYLAMLGGLLGMFVRRQHKTAELWGLFAALLSQCIQAFFGLSICLTAAFFWLLLGIFYHKLKEENT